MADLNKKPINKELYDLLVKESLLIKAAANGQINELFAGFPQDVEIPKEVLTQQDENGCNFLHYAAYEGHLNQVTDFAKKFGLDLEPAVNQANKDGNTFVFDAAFKGNLDQLADMSVELGLNPFAKPNKQNELDYTFLHYAANSGCLDQVPSMAKRINLDIVPYLYQQNVFGRTILHQSVKSGAVEQLSFMAKELGLDLSPMLDKQDTKENKTFLHYAAEQGSLDKIVVFAQEHKLDLKSVIGKKDIDGATFIETAAINGHLNQALALCKKLKINLTEEVIGDKTEAFALTHGQGAYANKLKSMVKPAKVAKRRILKNNRER